MCGICGIWGSGSNVHAVEAMVAAMYHRGPDDNGAFSAAQVSLGMTRLAIIDTTSGGHQPLKNQDGTLWIVYNGEAYNFQSERKLLEAKGHTFLSSSDTEVVLRMYEHYGDDFLLRIRGMFALAIFDRRRPGSERLLLARDQCGIKPLLYCWKDGKLIFASEMKALVASGFVAPQIDPEGLRTLLTFGSVYQPRTILRGVEMLPAAHRMIVENGRSRIERYWSFSPRRADLKNACYSQLVEAVADTLKESVTQQMISDVPLGAFLSGGIDSSLLVSMMAQRVSHKVKTFSVGFESEGAHIDETDEAERTARFIGTAHSRVVVTGTELRENIRHIAWSLDQPSVDGVNSYFVAREARRAVTVAISGNGGDELFAGYPSFIFMEKEQRRRPFDAAARALLASVAKWRSLDPLIPGAAGRLIAKARASAGFVTRYGNATAVFGPREVSRLLAPELRHQARVGTSLDRELANLDELRDGTTVQRVSGLSLRGYNNNQLLRDTDAVSMAHSLEVRVPFLDPVVSDVALSLPDSTKLGGTLETLPEQFTYRDSGAKKILFDIGKPLLPANFDLQQKRGFGMPFDAWLRGPLNEVFMDTLSERSIKARGLLNPIDVAKVRNEVEQGTTNWTRPWLLLMLELWCREILDRQTDIPRVAASSQVAKPAAILAFGK